jgi:hypothetical protein
LAYRDLGLLCRLLHLPLSRAGYMAVEVLGGAGVLLVCLLGRGAGWSSRQLLRAVLTLSTCWMTLLGPATESCTYILLAPALAWATWETFLTRPPRFVRGLLLASYGLFTCASLVCGFPGGAHWLALGPQPLAAVLLLAGLLVTYLFEMRRSVSRSVEGAERWPEISPSSV